MTHTTTRTLSWAMLGSAGGATGFLISLSPLVDYIGVWWTLAVSAAAGIVIGLVGSDVLRRRGLMTFLALLLALPALAAPQTLVCQSGGDPGDGTCYPSYLSDHFVDRIDPETRRVAIPRWTVSGEGESRVVKLLLYANGHPGKIRVTSTDGHHLLAAEEWFSAPGSRGSTEVTMPLPESEGGSVAVSIAWESAGQPYFRALVVSDAPSHPQCCAVLWNPYTQDGYRWIAKEGEIPWKRGR